MRAARHRRPDPDQDAQRRRPARVDECGERGGRGGHGVDPEPAQQRRRDRELHEQGHAQRQADGPPRVGELCPEREQAREADEGEEQQPGRREQARGPRRCGADRDHGLRRRGDRGGLVDRLAARSGEPDEHRHEQHDPDPTDQAPTRSGRSR